MLLLLITLIILLKNLDYILLKINFIIRIKTFIDRNYINSCKLQYVPYDRSINN